MGGFNPCILDNSFSQYWEVRLGYDLRLFVTLTYFGPLQLCYCSNFVPYKFCYCSNCVRYCTLYSVQYSTVILYCIYFVMKENCQQYFCTVDILSEETLLRRNFVTSVRTLIRRNFVTTKFCYIVTVLHSNFVTQELCYVGTYLQCQQEKW